MLEFLITVGVFYLLYRFIIYYFTEYQLRKRIRIYEESIEDLINSGIINKIETKFNIHELYVGISNDKLVIPVDGKANAIPIINIIGFEINRNSVLLLSIRKYRNIVNKYASISADDWRKILYGARIKKLELILLLNERPLKERKIIFYEGIDDEFDEKKTSVDELKKLINYLYHDEHNSLKTKDTID